MLALRDRGFARELLSWEWSGALLTAEIAAAKYVIRCERHEALAHAEIRDVGGSRRADIGSFPSVGEARAACDRHAAGLCVREQEPVPVDVRISPSRASSRKSAKPRHNPQSDAVSDDAPPANIAFKAERPRDQAPAGRRRRPWGTSPACLQRRARREPGDHADLDAALAAFAHVLGEE